MNQKLVIGIFMVPEEDAKDLVMDLEDWFHSNSIGMDWHDIKITEAIECLDPQQKILSILQRLTEKVVRANNIQHSGGRINFEDWAELYQLTNEASGLLESTDWDGPVNSVEQMKWHKEKG